MSPPAAEEGEKWREQARTIVPAKALSDPVLISVAHSLDQLGKQRGAEGIEDFGSIESYENDSRVRSRHQNAFILGGHVWTSERGTARGHEYK